MGSLFPLRLSFLVRVSSSWWHLGVSFAFSHYPVFCCSCGLAGFCLSCPPLFAGFVRPTSASLSLLLGLLFHGPALVGSSFRALSESLSTARRLLVSSFGVSPASGFAPSAATLLHPELLVAVACLCFFLCFWSACPTGGSSGLRLLAVCSVAVVRFLSAALPFSSLWSAGLCGWGLHPLWLSHIHWSPALSQVFSSPSRRRCWASASPLALLWGFGLASALEPSSGGFPVGGLVAPCACCPCVLRGVRGFPARGGFATCLLLTGAPGFGSFSFSSAPLSLCSSLIQPSSLWGLFLVGCGVYLWCLRPSSCASLSFFVRRLFVSLRLLGGWRPVVALSRLRGGVQLFCFLWRPPSPFFRLCPGRWVVFLALSFACRLVPVRRVFTVPCGFGVELCYLPCGPYARPLFGPLAVPPYLASCLVGVASPRL